MSTAFATGVVTPGSNAVQAALHSREPPAVTSLAPGSAVSAQGADTSYAEWGSNALACGAATGIALVSLKGLRRQGRHRQRARAAQLELIARRDAVSTHATVAVAPSGWTLPSKERTDDGRLWLGLEVMRNGKQGVVRYIGEVKFARGEWVGVEMLEGRGMHDGTVMGEPYFYCPPQMGIFAQSAQLQASGTADAAVLEETMRKAEIAASAPVVPQVVAAPAPSAPVATLTPVDIATTEDEEPTTLPSKEQTADGSVLLGQTVAFSGKQGVVRYIGDVKFAAGEWIGVELAEATGVHDGNVLGVPYFECEPKRGVFAQVAQLQIGGATSSTAPAAAAPVAPPDAAAPVPSAAAAPVPPAAVATLTPVDTVTNDVEESKTLPTKEQTVDGSVLLGQEITFSGKEGVVRYIGEVKFAVGEWIGVELKDATGVHDGNVLGVPYFECESKHGVFAQVEQVKTSGVAQPPMPSDVVPAAASPTVSASSTVVAAAEPAVSLMPEDEDLLTSPKETTAESSISLLQPVTWCGKQGTVRYVGEVNFAAGEWVGVELAEAAGMHDGTFCGVTYFECAPKHGVLAQAAQLKIAELAPAVVPADDEPDAEVPEDEPKTRPSKGESSDGSIALGQDITFSGKQGVVRYIGEVKFAAGEWIGVELAEATGVHDGNVLGVPYFECEPKHGVFAQVAQLQTAEVASVSPEPSAPIVAPTVVADAAPEDEEIDALREEKTADGSMSLGQTITWKGKQGVVRYIGEVQFGEGEWIGFELTEPAGMHDGSVLGVPYFQCEPKHGGFAKAEWLRSEEVPAAEATAVASAVAAPSAVTPATSSVPSKVEVPAAAAAAVASAVAAPSAATPATSSVPSAVEAAYERHMTKVRAAEARFTDSFDPAEQAGALEPLGFFDPLSLAPVGDEEEFRRLRVAELKHGRVAMLAAVGLLGQHFVRLPGLEQVPSGVGALTSEAGIRALVGVVATAGVIEDIGWLGNPFLKEDATDDPLDPNGNSEELRNKELSNGRFAMICVLGILAAELATGKDAAQQLGFR